MQINYACFEMKYEDGRRILYSHRGGFDISDIMVCIPLQVNRRFGGISLLHLQSWRIREARKQREVGRKQSSARICSSETSVDFQRTTWRYIAEERTLHEDGQSRLLIKPSFHARKVQKVYISQGSWSNYCVRMGLVITNLNFLTKL
jgi:hypothetical protein